MPFLKNIRYSKQDDFGSAIFLANSEKEYETFKQLTKYYEQLSEANPDTYLPIFSNKKFKYSSIKFKTNRKFEKNDVYNIKFVVKKKTVDDKTYINVYADSIDLVKKAEPEDQGEDIQLEE